MIIALSVIALDLGLHRKQLQDKDDARTLLRVAAFAAALLDLDETLELVDLQFGRFDWHHHIRTGIHDREAAVVPIPTRRTAMSSEGELRWLYGETVIGFRRARRRRVEESLRTAFFQLPRSTPLDVSKTLAVANYIYSLLD